MTLRRLLFWLHLAVGLSVGLLIAFLALTGGIISFQPQLITFAERGIHADHPPTAPCVLPSALLANAAAATSRPLTSLTLFADPTRPAQIALGPAASPDGSVLLADRCTGRILGPGANRLRVFLTTVRELHHHAAFRGLRHQTLDALKNAGALAFVFLTLSGLVIWLPRQLSWRHLRPALLLRGGLRGRAREWNLHNVVGFWLCLPLLAISTTGVIMAYPWANNLLFRLAGDVPPPAHREASAQPPSPPATSGGRPHHHSAPSRSDFTSLDAPIARALSFSPGAVSTSIRLPAARDLGATPTLAFQLAMNDRGQSMNRDQLTLSTADATVLKFEPFAQASRGRRWRIAARYLHTGEIVGAPGQALALLSTLGALLLVWTGISLSLRRLAAFRRRRRDSSTSTSATRPAHQQSAQLT